MRFAATVFTWDHDRNIYWKRRQPPLGRIIIDDEAISNEELSELSTHLQKVESRALSSVHLGFYQKTPKKASRDAEAIFSIFGSNYYTM